MTATTAAATSRALAVATRARRPGPFRHRRRPRRGVLLHPRRRGFGLRAARRWYWRQTLLSIAACLREPSGPASNPRNAFHSGARSCRIDRGLGTDLRAAIRFCWRHPLLSLTVVLDARGWHRRQRGGLLRLERDLPQEAADRDTPTGSSRSAAKDGGSFTYPEYLALRDLPGIEALIAGGRTSTTLDSTIDDARTRQRVVIDMVTANYFSALGVWSRHAGSSLRRRRR